MRIVQHVARRVVDVEQDGVIGAAGVTRIESHRVGGAGEEVRANQRDAVIGGKAGRLRQQISPVPIDHRIGELDHRECPDPIAAQRLLRRIAQTQAADEDIERCPRGAFEAQPRQFLLRDGEQTRHHMLVIELDLVDIGAHRQVEPAPQADHTHRRLLPAQLLEPCAHAISISAEPGDFISAESGVSTAILGPWLSPRQYPIASRLSRCCS